MSSLVNGKATKLYRKKEHFLSEHEHEYYECLCDLLNGTGYIVQPKVCFSSIVSGSRGAIMREFADFCVFDAKFRPMLIIKIDKEGYGCVLPGRKKEKRFYDALNTIGLPCMWLWVNYGANREYIESNLREYLKF